MPSSRKSVHSVAPMNRTPAMVTAPGSSSVTPLDPALSCEDLPSLVDVVPVVLVVAWHVQDVLSVFPCLHRLGEQPRVSDFGEVASEDDDVDSGREVRDGVAEFKVEVGDDLHLHRVAPGVGL